MERLTKYDEFGNAEFVGIDNTKLYERLVCDETVALTIATNKLAKLEDVLEKYNIENLEEATTHYDALVEENNTFLMENSKMAGEIKDLQHRLEVAEIATKLACKEELRAIGIYDDDLDYKKEMSILEQQYKEQAEEELKGE